jgi:hypothetical protein
MVAGEEQEGDARDLVGAPTGFVSLPQDEVSVDAAKQVAAPLTTVAALAPSRSTVTLVNLSSTRPAPVHLTSGIHRIAPKASLTVPADDMTDSARRAVDAGRIHLRTL